MKVSFYDYRLNVPIKGQYEYVNDYISCDFDLRLEESFYLIKQLKHDHSSVVFYGEAIVDFHIHDKNIHVQIDGDGFWFAENINFDIAKRILTFTYKGEAYFGQFIPKTTIEWHAYTP